MFGFGWTEQAEDEREEGSGPSGDDEESTPAPSLWNLAGALTASVKQGTQSLLSAVQHTDWKAELSALQQGLKEEGEEAVTRARAAAEQLPTAVEHLPEQASAALKARARMAHQQLEAAGKGLGSLGHKLVEGTSELFDQVSQAIQTELRVAEGDGAGARGGDASGPRAAPAYSRLDADVSAMQRDSSTYCDEPEDVADFAAWRGGFDLAAKQADIDALVAGNTFMRELQARIVPLIVEHDVFWTRYFYRLHLLQLKHQQITALTALTADADGREAEAELGWDSEEEAPHAEGDTGAGGAPLAPPPAEAPLDSPQQQAGDAAGPSSRQPLSEPNTERGTGSPSSWQEVSAAAVPDAEQAAGAQQAVCEAGAGGSKPQAPEATAPGPAATAVEEDLDWGADSGASSGAEATAKDGAVWDSGDDSDDWV